MKCRESNLLSSLVLQSWGIQHWAVLYSVIEEIVGLPQACSVYFFYLNNVVTVSFAKPQKQYCMHFDNTSEIFYKVQM